MKVMLRLTTSLLVCLSFVCGAVSAFAAESVSVCSGWPQEPESTAVEIAKRYEKYKSNEKLIDVYLKSVAHGFEYGVQGSLAPHMRGISDQMTEAAAESTGVFLGYQHGITVYCSMAGRNAKYRKP
jgi:hypothetical protein